MILQDLEPRSRLHLLLVESYQVSLRLSDLVLHFLFQFGDRLELFTLFLIDFLHLLFLAIDNHELQLTKLIL